VRWNQRYCQDPECRKEVARWQAAKRQQERRRRPEVRQQQAAAERERRARLAANRHGLSVPGAETQNVLVTSNFESVVKAEAQCRVAGSKPNSGQHTLSGPSEKLQGVWGTGPPRKEKTVAERLRRFQAASQWLVAEQRRVSSFGYAPLINSRTPKLKIPLNQNKKTGRAWSRRRKKFPRFATVPAATNPAAKPAAALRSIVATSADKPANGFWIVSGSGCGARNLKKTLRTAAKLHKSLWRPGPGSARQ
jgi:hypothetical protein